MLESRQNYTGYMLGCLLIAAWICVAQVLGSTLLIAACLAVFMAFVIFTGAKGVAVPVLLFFLPWATILKLAPGSISFYTLAIATACVVCLIKTGFKLNMHCLVSAVFLLALTLLSKSVDKSGLSMSYVMIVYLLALFPVMTREVGKWVDFRRMTLFFAAGIITAALSARELIGFGNIARYIDVYNWSVVTRLSGYYGDANFYAAHISAAIGGFLLLILKEKKWLNTLMYALLAMVLLYCGFLSASKTFILTVMLMFAVWLLAVLCQKRRGAFKVTVLLGALTAVFFVLTSALFSDTLQIVLFRFGQTTDISSLTTGRTERWKLYLEVLGTDPKVLLIGRGITALNVNGVAPHNTVLQLFYQLGLIGVVPLIAWLIGNLRNVLIPKGGSAPLLPVLVLLIGTFLPWMALDTLFFDEFFLIPLYVATGVMYLASGAPPTEERSAR